MQRLRCIITADCQLLFNQMYVKRDTPLLFFLQAHKKKKLSSVWRLTSLMQHSGWPKPNCHCKLMASKSHGFHFRVLLLWTPHADWGPVSITVPQRFGAPDPAMLMSGRSPRGVPSAERSLSMALADNTYIHLNLLCVQRTGYWFHSWCWSV